MRKFNIFKFLVFFSFFFACTLSAYARDIEYDGEEVVIYVMPGQPTKVNLPFHIKGTVHRVGKKVVVQRQKNSNSIFIFSKRGLSPKGEIVTLHPSVNKTFSLRVLPANTEHVRDVEVTITDTKEPFVNKE